MTDNEIIEVLEVCSNIVTSGCRECRLYSMHNANCVVQAMRNALDIIKRYKSEIEKKDTEIDILIRKNEALKDEVSELRADKEALINGQITLQEKLPGVIKNEAYKEFLDKLIAKAEIVAGGDYGFTYEIREDDIENLLTEMIRKARQEDDN